MRRLLVAAAIATVTLVGCGGDGDDRAAGDSNNNSLAAACEYIVANQDGVDPTPEEAEEVKRLANNAEFEQTYETVNQLQSETPDGPSLANLGALAEQSMKVRASCANAGVVIPMGE